MIQLPRDSQIAKAKQKIVVCHNEVKNMLTAFCLVVLFIFCGLLLGLIDVACAKNAEKKVRLIGKRRFGKMVHEEAKKRIKNT